jgi:putative FmdB family regulatory protein
MPTYEYACAACGHKFEAFQSITAAPIKKCPVCKKNKVQRLISAGAGFIFKGSGFYETDYRSDKYKADAKADTAPAATEAKTDSSAKGETAAKGDSGKAEVKPAAKAEAKSETRSETKSASEAKPAAKAESKPGKAKGGKSAS